MADGVSRPAPEETQQGTNVQMRIRAAADEASRGRQRTLPYRSRATALHAAEPTSEGLGFRSEQLSSRVV